MVIKDLPDVSLNVNAQINIPNPLASCMRSNYNSQRPRRASSQMTFILVSPRALGSSQLRGGLLRELMTPFPRLEGGSGE